jgi:hypothetical protein
LTKFGSITLFRISKIRKITFFDEISFSFSSEILLPKCGNAFTTLGYNITYVNLIALHCINRTLNIEVIKLLFIQRFNKEKVKGRLLCPHECSADCQISSYNLLILYARRFPINAVVHCRQVSALPANIRSQSMLTLLKVSGVCRPALTFCPQSLYV